VTPVSLAFPTPNDGWVLAGRGDGRSGAELLGTRDAGAGWVTEWSGALDPSEVVSTDPDHAWVLAQRCPADRCGSVLLGTSDADAHWSALTKFSLFADPPVPLRVYQIAFASPTLGLAAARNASCRDRATGPPAVCPGWILTTDDGGVRWRLAMKSPEPIIAVAFGHGAMWGLAASPGGFKAGVGTYSPSLTLLSSRDGGVSWAVGGAVHPPMIAGLDVAADVIAAPAGRVWLTAHDPESCAMHACGLDGAWSSGDSGLRWRPLRLGARFERGLGLPCIHGGAIVAGGTVAVAFNRQDCSGPSAALYRLAGSHAAPIHVWRSFVPAALAWPSPAVGYALGAGPSHRASLRRSTDGGRRWHAVAFTSR
jgi:hypothetical protein